MYFSLPFHLSHFSDSHRPSSPSPISLLSSSISLYLTSIPLLLLFHFLLIFFSSPSFYVIYSSSFLVRLSSSSLYVLSTLDEEARRFENHNIDFRDDQHCFSQILREVQMHACMFDLKLK